MKNVILINLMINRVVLEGMKGEKSMVIGEKEKSALLLAFINKDHFVNDLTYVVYQGYHNLKYSVIVLQIVGYMNKVLKMKGMNLQLEQYRCVVTGENRGIYEVANGSYSLTYLKNTIDTFSGETVRTFLYVNNTNGSSSLLSSFLLYLLTFYLLYY